MSLVIRDLCLSLGLPPGKKQILSQVSLALEPGNILALLGPSGSGKTTLLHCLLQLKTPDSGMVVWNGQKIDAKTPLPPTVLGGVLQENALFPHMNVLDNLVLAPKVVLKKPDVTAKQEAMALLDAFGLADRVFSYPHQLSGGERQRVAIARALMMGPELLILDEPTTGLNDAWVETLAEMLRNLAAHGMTVVLSTHHQAFAERVSDKTYELGSVTQRTRSGKTPRLRVISMDKQGMDQACPPSPSVS